MANYLTFQNIYESIMLAIGDREYARSVEVKAIANMIYMNEICQADELYPLFWLLDTDETKRAKAPVTAITSITKATPPVVTSIAHGLATGDLVTFYDVVVMTELEGNTYHATRLTADTFSLQDLNRANIVGAGYGAAGTSGEAHHRGTLLTSCRRVLNANWFQYEPMDFIGPDQLSKETEWLDNTTGIPTKFMHRQIYEADGTQNDYLLWYPGAGESLNLHLWYEKQIDRLSAAGDVPLLPPQFHDAIIAGAIMRLGENKVQVEAGVIWPSVYQSHMQAIVSLNRQWWAKYKPSERSGLYLV